MQIICPISIQQAVLQRNHTPVEFPFVNLENAFEILEKFYSMPERRGID